MRSGEIGFPCCLNFDVADEVCDVELEYAVWGIWIEGGFVKTRYEGIDLSLCRRYCLKGKQAFWEIDHAQSTPRVPSPEGRGEPGSLAVCLDGAQRFPVFKSSLHHEMKQKHTYCAYILSQLAWQAMPSFQYIKLL